MVEQAQQVAGLAGITGPLGVDVKLFAAQLVNIGVVVFVMWRWVYRPLLKVMDERTEKIERGLKQAESAAGILQDAESKQELALTQARVKAKEIIDEANRVANEDREAALKKTRTEVERIVAQGKSQMAEEKARALREARAEAAELVALAAGKVIGEKVDARKDEALIKSALAAAEK